MPQSKIANAKTRTEKAQSNRRRNRGRRSQGKTVTTAVEGKGVVENSAYRVLRPRTKMARKIGARTHGLSEAAQEFVHRHCNPCGERVTFRENSKVPDGALPNSSALELREVFIVRAPTTSSTSLSLNGDMWTLTVIHMPLFRNPLILVASMNNAEMTEIDRAALCDRWNVENENPRYPRWDAFGLAGNYWTTVTFSGLKTVVPPTDTGLTTDIEQFRIVSDGMTIFNNTPDLINQGMVIGAQWPYNVGSKTVELPKTDSGSQIMTSIYVNTGGSPARHGVVANFPVEATPPTVISSTEPEVISGTYATSTNENASLGYRTATLRVDSVNAEGSWVQADFTLAMDLVYSGVSYLAGEILRLTMTKNAAADSLANPFNVVVSLIKEGAEPTVVTTLNSATNTNFNITLLFPEGIEAANCSLVQLPPTSTEGIVQSTPKAVYMSMKEENGIYMVKRIFQPVFSVQKANEVRPIRLATASAAEGTLGATNDVYDLNYGVGVVVMSSIPTSCAPAIKLFRDVEIVAGDTSAFQLFMTSNEGECQPALEVVHAITQNHPFMYPESYNVLGTLMNTITGIISKVPLLGNIAGAVAHAVRALAGGTVQNGTSQNRLASMNSEEIAKLLPQLLTELGLK